MTTHMAVLLSSLALIAAYALPGTTQRAGDHLVTVLTTEHEADTHLGIYAAAAERLNCR